MKDSSQEDSKDFSFLLSLLSSSPSIPLLTPETLIFKKNRPLSFSYTSPSGTLKLTNNIRPNEIASKIIRKVRQRVSQDAVLKNNEVALVQKLDQSYEIIPNEKLVNLLLSKNPESLFPGLVLVQGLVNLSSTLSISYPISPSIPLEISKIISSIEENLRAKKYTMKKAFLVFEYSERDGFYFVNAFDIVLKKIDYKVDSNDLVQLRMSPDTRKHFIQSLEFHENSLGKRRFSSLEKVMNEHYQKIKQELDIDKALNKVFQIDVPEKTLPFIPKTKHADFRKSQEFHMEDARNTERTLRRLSVFQSIDFKTMKSTQRKRGRSIFD